MLTYAQVKKEEARALTDPTLNSMGTLAIETPVGKPLLPTLSGGTNENPAGRAFIFLERDKERECPASGFWQKKNIM